MSGRGIVESFINVYYVMGNDAVLSRVDLTIKGGEIILVRGRSGVGKTTLARIAALITPPSRGDVVFMGRSTNRLGSDERARLRLDYIGYIDQESTMIDEITVIENIVLPLRIRGVSRGEAYRRALEIGSILGIKDVLYRFPRQISGGQRQRAVIARALLKEPVLIVGDEPYSSLDDYSRGVVEEIISEYVEEHGAAALITTTDLLGRYRCSREMFLENGRLVSRS